MWCVVWAVCNHGIPQEDIDGYFQAAQTLFALPLHEKMKMFKDSNNRGYTPYADETLDPPNQVSGDTKEGFYFGREVMHVSVDLCPSGDPGVDCKLLLDWGLHKVQSQLICAMDVSLWTGCFDRPWIHETAAWAKPVAGWVSSSRIQVQNWKTSAFLEKPGVQVHVAWFAHSHVRSICILEVMSTLIQTDCLWQNMVWSDGN